MRERYAWTWLALLGLLLASAKALALAAEPPRSQSAPVLLSTGDWPPYSHGDRPEQGLLAELLTAALQSQGLVLRIDAASWRRSQYLLETGERFGAFPFVMTKARRALYDYSPPLLTIQGILFHQPQQLPQPLRWSNLADLQGYRLGGVAGSWYEVPLAQAGLKVEYTFSIKQNLEKLDAGRLDLVLSEAVTGWHQLRALFPPERQQAFAASAPLYRCDYHLLVSRSYPDSTRLQQRLNAGLTQLQVNGDYGRILARHGLANLQPQPQAPTSPPQDCLFLPSQ